MICAVAADRSSCGQCPESRTRRTSNWSKRLPTFEKEGVGEEGVVARHQQDRRLHPWRVFPGRVTTRPGIQLLAREGRGGV
jgi:hypothetical protein